MKLVVNKEYGGFSLPEEFCTQYNIDEYEDIDRTDDRLINFVENHSWPTLAYRDTISTARHVVSRSASTARSI